MICVLLVSGSHLKTSSDHGPGIGTGSVSVAALGSSSASVGVVFILGSCVTVEASGSGIGNGDTNTNSSRIDNLTICNSVIEACGSSDRPRFGSGHCSDLGFTFTCEGDKLRFGTGPESSQIDSFSIWNSMTKAS
jgi:hypothetical protein